jgi:hypothetical protein
LAIAYWLYPLHFVVILESKRESFGLEGGGIIFVEGLMHSHWAEVMEANQ